MQTSSTTPSFPSLAVPDSRSNVSNSVRKLGYNCGSSFSPPGNLQPCKLALQPPRFRLWRSQIREAMFPIAFESWGTTAVQVSAHRETYNHANLLYNPLVSVFGGPRFAKQCFQ